ncbi:MAG TPA: iron ABC transporter permease [Polyangiales bacterium]|nr:iron ABC transporter permease [Polyangiales bacterium]
MPHDSHTTARRRSAAAGDAVLAPSRAFVVCLVGLIVASVLVGLFFGRGGVLDFGGEPVLLRMRAHRALVAFLCGGALSVAGAVVQTLFRNPLASPQILGTTSGATLGAHVALLGSVLLLRGSGVFGIAPEMLIPIGATIGASLSLFLLLAVVSLREEPLALLLTGFALMSLFQGASTFLMSVNQEAWELNRAFAALNQGDISAAGPRQVLLVLVMTIGGVVPVLASSTTLDVLVSGDDEARTLGVDVSRVRFWLVLWVAILTAGAVAVGGSVGFVGLIAPHALRPWVGQRHRYLVPAVFAGGGCFVVVCDVLCRLIPLRSGVPVGVLIDLIGAPIFLRLLLRQMRTQADHG